MDIITLLAKRLSNKEIAERLFISPGTVKLHTVNIYKKLNTHNRQEAVVKAQSLGLC
jgi:DNA-binding NarL/FixJ family response regulator